jgi:hypothetical protein
MNFRRALIVLPLVVFATDAALAETVSIKDHSKDKVQGKCSGDGDVFWANAGTGHTYGCMHADGSGIVCSGASKAQKKTCDTFKLAPQKFPFPNREEPAKSVNP